MDLPYYGRGTGQELPFIYTSSPTPIVSPHHSSITHHPLWSLRTSSLSSLSLLLRPRLVLTLREPLPRPPKKLLLRRMKRSLLCQIATLTTALCKFALPLSVEHSCLTRPASAWALVHPSTTSRLPSPIRRSTQPNSRAATAMKKKRTLLFDAANSY